MAAAEQLLRKKIRKSIFVRIQSVNLMILSTLILVMWLMINLRGWRLMMNKRKQKKRLGNTLAKRRKEIERDHIAKAWRNIFVKAGVLNGAANDIRSPKSV